VVNEQNDNPSENSDSQTKEYRVSEEVYNKTFQDITSFIEELNIVIQKKDYEKWLTYLTSKYITETSRIDYLNKWREDKILKEKKIVLSDLRDYFDFLVVPRRANVKLDLLEFLDDSHLYAYTIVKGEKYLLYYLINTTKGWKIDFY
jgi:hypothetical protein